MAKCQVCGKRPVAGKNVSHSNRKTNRWFKPNVQKVRVLLEDGTIKRMWVCTDCLSSGKVKRYVSTPKSEVMEA
ncbi:50S ribosomal protein L28 [Thermosipho ferrireducens]|uniref:Large ribosomal subunit protein bL28 n=1 Tax=Thermosipho ferrireducens TaxID=2571116 RepID=A0ABX7S7R6_9BACT|nr:50S ribosomal protein L28 [Thermosipho ferrireducens]QTA37155.1 50S ribosomal protein L28 [Thermosipho ferrireducens]